VSTKKQYFEVRIRISASLYRKLKLVAEKNQVNRSRVAAMAVYVGLPFVQENLEGMNYDLEAAGWSLTNKGSQRMSEISSPQAIKK
jgi:hypothetical protein